MRFGRRYGFVWRIISCGSKSVEVLSAVIICSLLVYIFTLLRGKTLLDKTADSLFKTVHQFSIEPLVPFYSNETQRCNADTTCYENWLAKDWKIPSLNQSFSNPCWNTYNLASIQCIPHIYLVGWAKSGTTEMWWYWNHHPQLISNSYYKETQFLTQFSFTGVNHTKMVPFARQIEYYFGDASNRLLKSGNRNLLMFDCSATTIYDNWHWKIKQGYQGDPNIPTHTNFHYLRRIHPQTKIVVMMRNPVDRALSFYNHGVDMSIKKNANLGFSYKPIPESAEDIHTFFVDSIWHFTNCVEEYSLRSCCHMAGWNSQDWADPRKFMTLRIGIYYVFLEEIYKNFPIDQVLLIKSEDFFNSTVATVTKTFQFLGVDTAGIPHMVQEKEKKGIMMSVHKYFTPLPKTRQLLKNFYKPYNARLAEMLQSTHWLTWN